MACSMELLGKILEVLHECPTVRLLVSGPFPLPGVGFVARLLWCTLLCFHAALPVQRSVD